MAHETYIQQHGTSYYLANLLFPGKLRDEVSTLYAMVRIIDDIVDEQGVDLDLARAQIQTYQQIYNFPETTRESEDITILTNARHLADQQQFPEEWMEAFFDAMISDSRPTPYQTYAELQAYMYGSAEVIGLMMCQLIGYDESQKDEVCRTARLLGEAMQYTNFLRDIREDYVDYGRIYIPANRLAVYGLTHDDLIAYCQGEPITQSRKDFIQWEIDHCRALYDESTTGIQYLHPDGRDAVALASDLYAGILTKIEKIRYDMFAGDAHTFALQKTTIAARYFRNTIPLRQRLSLGVVSVLFAFAARSHIAGVDLLGRDHPGTITAIFALAAAPLIIHRKRYEALGLVAITTLIEWIGHTTSLPFGEYVYHTPWTSRGIADVPLFIPLARLLVMGTASRCASKERLAIPAVIGLDLLLEPFATQIHYRTRATHTGVLTAPLHNYLARGVIAIGGYYLARRWNVSRVRSFLMYLTLAIYVAVVLVAS